MGAGPPNVGGHLVLLGKLQESASSWLDASLRTARSSGRWLWGSSCLGEAFLTGTQGLPLLQVLQDMWACPRALKAETPARGRGSLRRQAKPAVVAPPPVVEAVSTPVLPFL